MFRSDPEDRRGKSFSNSAGNFPKETPPEKMAGGIPGSCGGVLGVYSPYIVKTEPQPEDRRETAERPGAGSIGGVVTPGGHYRRNLEKYGYLFLNMPKNCEF